MKYIILVAVRLIFNIGHDTGTFKGSRMRTPKAVPNMKDNIQSLVLSGPNSNEYRNVNVPGTRMHRNIRVYAKKILHQGSIRGLFLWDVPSMFFCSKYSWYLSPFSRRFLKIATIAKEGRKVITEDMKPT